MNFEDLDKILEKKNLSLEGATRMQPFIEYFASEKIFQKYFSDIIDSLPGVKKRDINLAQKLYETAKKNENNEALKMIEQFFSRKAVLSAEKKFKKKVFDEIEKKTEKKEQTLNIEKDPYLKKLSIEEQTAYKKFLNICELRLKIKGIGGGDLRKRAYNVVTLFKNIESVDKYLSASTPGKPSHTFLEFKLPKSNNWNKLFWKKMSEKYGYDITKYIHLAPEIETLLQEDGIELNENIEFKTIEDEVLKFSYKDGEKHKEIAKIGIQLKLSQKQFDRTIKELQYASKIDRTPNINFSGSEIGFPGYRIERTPKSSPLNLWIGGFPKINNCCKIDITQGTSAGGNTSGEGLALALSHFDWISQYVILSKRNNPVAKMTGWVQDDNFVINSWQSYGNKYSKLAAPFIKKMVEIAFEQNPKIKNVYFGVGKAEPKESNKKIGGIYKKYLKKAGLPDTKTEHPIRMKDPYYDDDMDLCPYDSEHQILLASRE